MKSKLDPIEPAALDNRLMPNRPTPLERGNRILAELAQGAVAGALPPKPALHPQAVQAEFNRD